ncbi:hypothetical protein PQU92_12585 [Asticcacaulis sp. BYS171W]|uniref:Uncharacterized protein n=1 Tax=Asticcacaulis aquaticus TaxID=2984212 RepID=A0ABT5HVP7_9CAUL|nr:MULTISPECIES: hypothetical protein [Asticcacaulis]ESQ79113.1 hypothetical protein AEYBE204_10690 [Asticcacaulis sp. YBE204]MDC7684119.1 hypothetical protein [Asticcacaulis aquaticus]
MPAAPFIAANDNRSPEAELIEQTIAEYEAEGHTKEQAMADLRHAILALRRNGLRSARAMKGME